MKERKKTHNLKQQIVIIKLNFDLIHNSLNFRFIKAYYLTNFDKKADQNKNKKKNVQF